MTDLELEVMKLRWHVETMDALFMALASFLFSASQGVSPQALSRVFEQVITHAQEAVAAALPAEIASEERRDQLQKAFDEEMEKMKKLLASLPEDPPQ